MLLSQLTSHPLWNLFRSCVESPPVVSQSHGPKCRIVNRSLVSTISRHCIQHTPVSRAQLEFSWFRMSKTEHNAVVNTHTAITNRFDNGCATESMGKGRIGKSTKKTMVLIWRLGGKGLRAHHHEARIHCTRLPLNDMRQRGKHIKRTHTCTTKKTWGNPSLASKVQERL